MKRALDLPVGWHVLAEQRRDLVGRREPAQKILRIDQRRRSSRGLWGRWRWQLADHLLGGEHARHLEPLERHSAGRCRLVVARTRQAHDASGVADPRVAVQRAPKVALGPHVVVGAKRLPQRPVRVQLSAGQSRSQTRSARRCSTPARSSPARRVRRLSRRRATGTMSAVRPRCDRSRARVAPCRRTRHRRARARSERRRSTGQPRRTSARRAGRCAGSRGSPPARRLGPCRGRRPRPREGSVRPKPHRPSLRCLP